MSEAIHVLAIHAHPDDVEFQCAGTLALLGRSGCRITIATMTPGDCGSAEYGPEEIATIRRGEGKAAADLIGARYECLEFRDLAIFNDDESRRRMTEFLRRTKPDVIFTAPPEDYLDDHEMTSLLVRDACFSASVPNYVTRLWEPAPPLPRIPYLYYVDSIEGKDRSGRDVGAGFHVDVTEVFAVKKSMLACHASQRDWLLKQHGIDEYMDSQETWSRRRGHEIGVEHAEAFRQYNGHPYPHENQVLKILNQDGKGGK